MTPPIVARLMIWAELRGGVRGAGRGGVSSGHRLWLTTATIPASHPVITSEDLARLPPPGAPSMQGHRTWGTGTHPAHAAGDAHLLLLRLVAVAVPHWLPSFFLQGYNLDIKNRRFWSGVFFAGVVGDALGGIISDHLLHKPHVTLSRLSVIVTGMLAPRVPSFRSSFSRDIFTLHSAFRGILLPRAGHRPIWWLRWISRRSTPDASGLMIRARRWQRSSRRSPFGYIVDVTALAPAFHRIGGAALLGSALAFTMHPEIASSSTSRRRTPLPSR